MIASALCCDLCPNVFIAEKAGTNSYLTRAAISAGWTSTKDDNGHWSNTCDECTPEAIVAAYENGDRAHLTVQGKSRHHGTTDQEKP